MRLTCLGTGTSSSPPTSPPTFASALASATVPANTIAMAVQAENVPLQFHGPHVSVTQIGDAYGCLVRRFGNVTALAPPTMIVLNSHPSQPNIYADLQPNETAKLLLASLSQSQWQALTSEQGMGMSDLTDDNQRQMFMALFPGGKLKIYTNGERQKGSQDLSQEFPQAHLRIYQKTEIFLPLQGNTGESVSMDVASQPGQPKTYNIEQDYQEKATEYGVPVRAEQPNILKPSDLDYNSNAVHVPIVLAGLKSVSDLVSRIAQQSHLELYTDPRYSNQSLTLVGQLPTAYASDLLRALSLCLTGTWRQVGPAFVLTFDETGLGTTRQIWQNFEQQAQNLKRAPMDAAGDKMVTDHSLQDLNAFGDTLAITPDQTAAWKKDNPDDYSYSGTPRMMRFAVSQLTPAQQATMKAMNDMWVEMAKNPMNNERGTDISGKIGVESVPTLQLLLPSLDGPVTMHQMFDLFQPSPKMQQEMWQKHSAAQVKPLSPTAQPAMPLLAEVMGRIQSRVVLASPRTPADVTAIVGAMKTLGFNQLWVTVFSEGQSHPDLLVAALKATKGSGIAVFPVLSLLQWGMDAPPETRDLTILGETSAQMEQVNQQAQNAVSIAAGQKPFPLTPPISLFVMPGSSQVAGTLANFVHFYGTHPGIAGLIWTETASVGYTGNISYGQQGLGYALPARLEFLRQFHADPIDLGSGTQVDTNIPNFGDYLTEEKLGKQWLAYLSATDHALLKHLYTAAGNSTLSPRIFTANQNSGQGGDWYGSWDGPNAPLPTYHGRNENNNQQPAQPVAQAKSQSKIALASVFLWDGMTTESLASQLTDTFKHDHWDGFVLQAGDGKDFVKMGSRKSMPPATSHSGR